MISRSPLHLYRNPSQSSPSDSLKPNVWLSGSGEEKENSSSGELNLYTLIDSVEKDIELLEQLESGSQQAGGYFKIQRLSDTEDLYNLPGYRPRANQVQSNQERRKSIESSKSTNPGYDALLCTRLYPGVPSTPPPLPRKLKPTHRRTHSDSNITVKPLPEDRPPAARDKSKSNLAAQIFCPLCPGYFYSQAEFQDHLLRSHYTDLLHDKVDVKLFKKETCPCCEAEFLKPGLGPQHLVDHHSEYVCSIMFARPPTLAHVSSPTMDRHSFCLLCGQRFLKKQVKLLALHLQQQHPLKFSQVMDTYFVKDKNLPVMKQQKQRELKPEYYRETEYNENKEINSRKSQPSGNKKLRLEPIQQTGNFKKFTRVFPPQERSETYRGVEQPEPELSIGPVTAVENKDWEREMFRSVADTMTPYTYNSDKVLFRWGSFISSFR